MPPPRRARGRGVAIRSLSDSDPEWDPSASSPDEEADDEPLALRRERQSVGRGRSASPDSSDEDDPEPDAPPASSRRTPAGGSRGIASGEDRGVSSPVESTRKRGRAVIIEDSSDDDDAPRTDVGTRARDRDPDARAGAGAGPSARGAPAAASRASRRPRRAAAAAASGVTPGTLTLRRGIRSPSPATTSDSDSASDSERERHRRPPRRTPRSNPPRSVTREVATTVRRGIARRRAARADAVDWEYGHMRHHPEFYDRRSKVKIVGLNAERVSSDEELTSDSFIAHDSEDEHERDDEDGDDEQGGGGEESDEKSDEKSVDDARPAKSTRTFARRQRAPDGTDDESDDDETDDDDDGVVVRRRRVSGRRAALVEDEDEDEDEDKDKDEDEGFVDASPGKRASGRISSGRRRKSEVWKRNWTALREGKRREDAELETDDEEDRRDGGEEDDDLQDFIDFIEDDLETEALDAEAKRKRGSRGTEDRRGSRLRARPGEPSASAFLARALMDDDFAPRRSRADARGATATKSDDDDDDDENLGDDDDNFVDEWVACECGVDRDDGAAMIQCCNPRCGVWQHAACVDVDPDEFEHRGNASRWYCARCDAAGRSRAPAPPEKPASGARTDTTSPSSRRIWSSKMTEALRADDFRAAKTLLMRHPNPPSRGAMLARAAAAAARECVRLLMGGGGGNVGSETSRGLPPASPGDVARALHLALAAGHADVVETMRDALGSRFVWRKPGGWPRSEGGATLTHSAADNAKGDPRCVWLALEAEGEPPRATDEAAAAEAARAAAAVASPPPPALDAPEDEGEDVNPDGTKRETKPNGEGGVKAAAEVTRRVGDIARASPSDAAPPLAVPSLASPSFAASAATTNPGTTLARGRSPLPSHIDRPAACVADDRQVTPLMRAAGAGPGWEGCVAALLYSAAARGSRGSVAVAGRGSALDAAAAVAALRDEESEASAAHYAAGSGAVASLRLLVSALPGCVRAVDAGGATPLHHAAAAGQDEAIRVLTDELGVSRSVADTNGWIPLLYADWSSRRESVLTLMAADLEDQLGAMQRIVDNPMSRPKVLRVLGMLATVPPFYEALNRFLADRVEILDGPLSFLLHRAKVVDFANRRAWLRRKLRQSRGRVTLDRRGRLARGGGYDVAERFGFDPREGYEPALVARHSSPWRDFRDWALDVGPEGLVETPLHLHARFAGTQSVASGPGVERELMDRIAADVVGGGDAGADGPAPGWDVTPTDFSSGRFLDDAAGTRDFTVPLLAPASEGSTLYRPPDVPSKLPERLEDDYAVLGRLLGYAVAHESPFPVALASATLKGLLGRAETAGWEDLEEMDPQEAKSLGYIRDAPSGVASLALTFAVEEEEAIVSRSAEDEARGARRVAVVNLTGAEESGSSPAGIETETPRTRMVEFPLVRDGASRGVTDTNKEEYVRLRAAHKLARATRSAAVEAMRRGLREIIPADDLRVFSAPELACMLGGVADIDVAEWRAHTEYEGGYREESPQIRWLWRLVSRFSPEERTLLLKFVTGSSRVPVGGFAALRGMAGTHPFHVMRVPAERAPGRDDDGFASGNQGAYALPTSATCFNTLRLPEYPTYDVLEQQVTTALRHGVEGFAFG